LVEIIPNQAITPSRKKNKQEKHKREIHMDDFIPIDYEEIVDLDKTHLNHKRRKSNVGYDEDVIARSQYHNESPKGIKEIITPSVDLEDNIMKTTQNAIQNKLRTTNLVDDGHRFQLNVKQIYKPIEGKKLSN
jgi:hypothetical protein